MSSRQSRQQIPRFRGRVRPTQPECGVEGHFARQPGCAPPEVQERRGRRGSARAPILPLGNHWKKMVCTGGGWPAPIILSGLVGSGPMSHPRWASPLRLQVALDCRQKHKSFGLISLFPSSALREFSAASVFSLPRLWTYSDSNQQVLLKHMARATQPRTFMGTFNPEYLFTEILSIKSKFS